MNWCIHSYLGNIVFEGSRSLHCTHLSRFWLFAGDHEDPWPCDDFARNMARIRRNKIWIQDLGTGNDTKSRPRFNFRSRAPLPEVEALRCPGNQHFVSAKNSLPGRNLTAEFYGSITSQCSDLDDECSTSMMPGQPRKTRFSFPNHRRHFAATLAPA